MDEVMVMRPHCLSSVSGLDQPSTVTKKEKSDGTYQEVYDIYLSTDLKTGDYILILDSDM